MLSLYKLVVVARDGHTSPASSTLLLTDRHGASNELSANRGPLLFHFREEREKDIPFVEDKVTSVTDPLWQRRRRLRRRRRRIVRVRRSIDEMADVETAKAAEEGKSVDDAEKVC